MIDPVLISFSSVENLERKTGLLLKHPLSTIPHPRFLDTFLTRTRPLPSPSHQLITTSPNPPSNNLPPLPFPPLPHTLPNPHPHSLPSPLFLPTPHLLSSNPSRSHSTRIIEIFNENLNFRFKRTTTRSFNLNYPALFNRLELFLTPSILGNYYYYYSFD